MFIVIICYHFLMAYQWQKWMIYIGFVNITMAIDGAIPHNTFQFLNDYSHWQLIQIQDNGQLQSNLMDTIWMDKQQNLNRFCAQRIFRNETMPDDINKYLDGDSWFTDSVMLKSIGAFWFRENQLHMMGEFNDWDSNKALQWIHSVHPGLHQTWSNFLLINKSDNIAFLLLKSMEPQLENDKPYYILRLVPFHLNLWLDNNEDEIPVVVHKPNKSRFNCILIIFGSIMMLMLIICIAFYYIT